jgi:hypothetical protein
MLQVGIDADGNWANQGATVLMHSVAAFEQS